MTSNAASDQDKFTSQAAAMSPARILLSSSHVLGVWWRSSTHSDTLTMQHLNCGQQGHCLSGNAQRRQRHRNTHGDTHARPVLLCLSSQHVQSNYRERTRPEPCTPSDLAPGQIDEALYRPRRSNNSFQALISRTREDVSDVWFV